MSSNLISSIPSTLQREGLRYIKVRSNGKEAVESEWQTKNNYTYDNPVIQNYVSSGYGNYGIIPVGEGICILDVDEFDRLDQLGALDAFADTFKVRSGSDKGEHYHYFFTCSDLTLNKKLVLQDPEENGKHLGEIFVPGCNAYVVGAGSTHPSGNKYVIVNDVPLKEISIDTLEETLLCKVNSKHIFANAKLQDQQIQHRIPTSIRKPFNSLGEELGLRIENFAYPSGVIERKGSEIQGSHPFHDSTTGKNFAINTQKNNWHCYRCDSGGGAIEAIAVAQGWISCEDAGTIKIEGDLFLKVKQYLKENGFQKQIEDHDAEYRHRGVVPVRTVDTEELDAMGCGESLKFEQKLPKNNILAIYQETLKKCSDAYIEYHFGAGMSILSTIICRNAVCKMAQGDIYPNTWIFMLGISTSSRKSTVIKQARRFLVDLTPSTQLPSSFSPEGFLEELSDSPRSWLFKDEVGQLMSSMQKSYMSDMRDTFCDLYECQPFRRKLRKSQRKGASETIITDPYITMLVATTPSNFNEYATTLDITSGWLLRYLFFAPRYSKEIMPLKPMSAEASMGFEEIKGIFSSYYNFFHSGQTMEFRLSEDALYTFQQWHIQREKDLVETGDEIELSIYGRIVTYAVKLAILFTVGSEEFRDYINKTEGKMPEDGLMEIDDEYIVEACRQMDEYFFPMACSIAREVDRSETTNLQNKILGILQRKGGKMKKRDLMQILHISVKQLTESLDALVASEEIEIVNLKEEGKIKPTEFVLLLEQPKHTK